MPSAAGFFKFDERNSLRPSPFLKPALAKFYVVLGWIDLPPEAPSFITGVCGLWFHVLRRQFGKRVVCGALKLHKRSTRFSWYLVLQ